MSAGARAAKHRLIRGLLIGLVLAAAIGGCGDNSSDQLGTIPGSTPGTAGPAGTSKHGRAAAGSSSKSGKAAARASAAPDSRQARKLQKLSPPKRRDYAVRVAASILGQMALPVARIAVTRNVDWMRIAIAPKYACSATRADEPRVTLVLGRLLPVVKTIEVTVAGTKQHLGDYVAAHCKPVKIPPGSGKVVFDKSGAGALATPAIKITAKRWTVGYESQASFLQVIAKSKGGGVKALGFVARGRSVGLRIFKGPGTFTLRILSPATWSVVVRDGA